MVAEQQTCIRKTCRAIEASAGVPAPAELGAQVGMSPTHLQRAFKAMISRTP